jgi:hypothetical protein
MTDNRTLSANDLFDAIGLGIPILSRTPKEGYGLVLGPTGERRYLQTTHIDTFEIASSAHDGCVSAADTVWRPTTGVSSLTTDIEVVATKSGATYTNREALLRWDTSSIPDSAIVTAASLKCYIDAKFATDALSVAIEWYDPGTIANDDYTSTPVADAHVATLLSAITDGALHTFVLIGAAAEINKAGFTGLRVFMTGVTPTGSNQFDISDFADAEPSAQLIVTYTA